MEIDNKQDRPIASNTNEKVKLWLKDPYNLAFLGLLFLAFAIRLYYFFLTKNQPLWWDEAEYSLKAKHIAFGTPLTGWAPEREIIVPFLFSIILKLGFGEVALKFIQLLVSVATVFMTYILICKVANKKTAIVATFGMTFFWLHIFFTQRILLYLWAPLFYLLITYFFYTGFLNENKKNLVLFAIFASLGIQVYFSIGFLLFGLFIYLFLIEGFSILKNRKAWTALGIFILILMPYMIYSQITYGAPIPRLARGYTAVTKESGAGISGLTVYISMFPSRVGWVFTILSFLGLGYFLLNFLAGIGVKEHIKKEKGWFLLFMSFFMPLLFYTLYGTVGGSGTFYDAFILPVFPFAFAFAGLCLEKIYAFFLQYGKTISLIIVTALLIFHAYFGITNSDLTIKNKISSYDSVKEAGLWLKENSNPSDLIISSSVAQITYYSERNTVSPNNFTTEEEFDSFVRKEKPSFILDSIWERIPQWFREYIAKHNDTLVPVEVYFLDAEKKQPSLIIYKVKQFS